MRNGEQEFRSRVPETTSKDKDWSALMTTEKKLLMAFAALLCALVLSGCSIHTSERKDSTGKSEDVDIRTPFGSISVKENSTDAKDTGLQLYPGARPKSDSGDDKHSANVNISSP